MDATRRHIRKSWPDILPESIDHKGEVFPAVIAHVWDWFLDLIPLEGLRWQAGDVDLIRAAQTLALVEDITPTAFEMRLLAAVICQVGQLNAATKGDEDGN